MTTATTGTGTITLGSAVSGYQTFAGGGVANSDTVKYLIEDGSNWEIGTGTYTSSGTTMSRSVIESTNADAAINLSGSATVSIIVEGTHYDSLITSAAVAAGYQPLATVLTNTTASFTTADETKLDGIETAADVTDAVNIASSIVGVAGKTTPVDADTIPLIDSAASNALKELTWANLKATAKTYFDTLYQPLVAALTSWGAITRASGFDTFVATPSSANFKSLITDETGSGGAVVFATSPAITTPTLTDPTITGAIAEDVYTITDGAGFQIDPGNGTIQQITLGASRTPAATNFASGESVTLKIADGSAYTITWSTVGVTWVGGTAPTLATTGWTIVVLWKDGSTIYGKHVGDVA